MKAVADAYADAVRVQAQAHAATVKAQAAALDAHTASLLQVAPQKRRVALATGDAQTAPWHWERDDSGTPIPVPDGGETPACPPCQPLSAPAPPHEYTPAQAPLPAGVDAVTATVLAWVALLYDDAAAVDTRDRRITVELPWSTRARGEYALPRAERARVRDALLGLQPPLFAELPGNALALVGRSKWFALEKVKGVLG